MLGRFTATVKGRCRGPVAGALVLALIALVAWMGLASAATTVTEPTITAHPSELANQTSATFSYSDSQSGVTFQCSLDAGGYLACPASGVTYSGLTEGSHTFRVRAVSGSKTSAVTTFKWLIDTTAPTAMLTFPTAGGSYGASSWSCGSAGASLCGKAKDAHGIAGVLVSIQQGSGNWWGGSSFDKTSETFNATTLESPGAITSGWSYALPLPPAGTYTVHVRATDVAGNTTPAAEQASATFTIKTSPPPAPSITSGPEHETGSKSATFSFSDTQAGVTFVCAKDKSQFTTCSSPKTYSPVSQASHTFYVEARDAAGNLSSPTSYAWTVLRSFPIEGALSGELSPGATRSLPLTVSNPASVTMTVTSLQVTVQTGSSKPGCDGPTNLQVTQSNVSTSNPLNVPAKGKVTLPSGGVTTAQVLMKNLSTNQDACKGATFTFNYSGSGHS